MKDKILSILSNLEKYLSLQVNKFMQKEKAKIEMRKRIEYNNLLLYMMLQMRNELYLIFQYDTYNLAPVTQPESIRILDYSIVDNTYQYYFAINKKSYDTIPNPALKELTDRMNYNISIAFGNQINYWGKNVVLNTYPFLSHGMWIIAIQDNKQSEVHIVVRTNLTPQEFKEKYHQNSFTFMTY